MGRFALALVLGFLLWVPLESLVSSGFRATGGVALSLWTFGTGGHAELLPASGAGAASEQLEADASWNTRLLLRIDGVRQSHSVRVNPRRTVYLPLVVFVAAVFAAPLDRARKLRCCAVGAPMMVVVALGHVFVIATWLFARVPGLVFTLGPVQRGALELAYRALVVPLANKFILAVLLAAVLAYWQHGNAARAEVGTSQARVSAMQKGAAARRSAKPRASVRRGRKHRRPRRSR